MEAQEQTLMVHSGPGAFPLLAAAEPTPGRGRASPSGSGGVPPSGQRAAAGGRASQEPVSSQLVCKKDELSRVPSAQSTDETERVVGGTAEGVGCGTVAGRQQGQ